MEMRRLKKSECTILPLVLKKQWYDMIASGEKKEEYREYKDFWIKRIDKWQSGRMSELFPYMEQKSDVIAFSCGYKKADIFYVCDKIIIREGAPLHPEWGEPNVRHFALGLGGRVDLCV